MDRFDPRFDRNVRLAVTPEKSFRRHNHQDDRLRHRSAPRRLGGAGQGSGGEAGGMPAEGGLCPANHESAGKQKHRGTRKGNSYLKATLVTAAVCGARTKGAYLRDTFHLPGSQRFSVPNTRAAARRRATWL